MIQLNHNLTIANSLQLMLQVILTTHFNDIKCLIQLHSNKYYDFSVASIDIPFPVYVNPTGCIPGCNNYILFNPLHNSYYGEDVKNTSSCSVYIGNCIKKHSRYTFKGIIFQDNQENLKDYIYFNRVNPSDSIFYIAHAIFIQRKENYFVVSAFDNWDIKSYSVLARWYYVDRKFEGAVNEFYSDERRKNHSGVLRISGLITAPIFIQPEKIGNELNMLKKFAASMNLKLRFREFRTLYIGYFGSSDSLPCTYPISSLSLTFLVPKPKKYIYWLEILQVLTVDLWMAVILCFIVIGTIFWAENRISTIHHPGFTSVVGLFLLQGLNDYEIPVHVRARLLIATLLILAVLYSSVFASGVVPKMMTPRYKDDVRTFDDLAKMNFTVEWTNNPMLQYDKEYYTESEKQAFSRYCRQCFEVPYTKKAMAHYITATKLSTALSNYYETNKGKIQTMDEIFMRTYTTIVASTNYILYIPKVNSYHLRCLSAGLMLKWEWDAYRARNKMATLLAYLDKNSVHSETDILVFTHVQGVFLIWLIGVVLGIVAFIAENIRVITSKMVYY